MATELMEKNIEENIKELPRGWELVTLGEVLYVKNGYAFKSTDYCVEGISLVRISEIKDNNIDLSKAVNIPASHFYPDYTVEKGDFLIAMSGATTGKTGVYSFEHQSMQNQRVGNLKLYSKNNFNDKYRNYYISNLRKDIEKAAYGGAQPNISGRMIESLLIPVAPLNEQHRIVDKIEELFSELDKGVESLNHIKIAVKKYRQSVLKSGFNGELTKQWREKNKDKLEPASILLNKIKSERKAKLGKSYKEFSPSEYPSISEVPAGWSSCKLGNIIELNYGKNLSKAKRDNIGYDVYGSNGVVGKHSVPLIETECLVVGRKGSIGEVHYSKQPSWVIDTTYFIDNFYGQPILYWYHILKFLPLNKMNRSTAIPGLNRDDVYNTDILLPSIPEQEKIVEEIEKHFSIADAVERAIDESLKQSGRLRQSILKQAFEGKLVPQDPTDEPASELLKRIKEEKEALNKTKKGRQ